MRLENLKKIENFLLIDYKNILLIIIKYIYLYRMFKIC